MAWRKIKHRVVRKGFAKKQRPEGESRASWGKNMAGRGSRWCKGPEAEGGALWLRAACLWCWGPGNEGKSWGRSGRTQGTFVRLWPGLRVGWQQLEGPSRGAVVAVLGTLAY